MKISWSAVKLFKRCEYAFKLKYIDGIRIRRRGSIHTVRGNAVHETIEEGLPKEFTLEQAVSFHRKAFYRLIDEERVIVSDEDAELAVGQQMIEAFWDGPAQKLFGKVVEVEKRFDIDLGDGLIMTGFIDLVERAENGGLGISDWKTGKVVADDVEEKDPYKIDQMGIYSVAAVALWGELPEWLAKVYLKTGGLRVPYKKTLEDNETLVASMRALYKSVTTRQPSEFKENFDSCKWCDFKPECDRYQNQGSGAEGVVS